MQRNFGPTKCQVEEWQALPLSTAAAKGLEFVEDVMSFPQHLAQRVDELYFQPRVKIEMTAPLGRG